MRVRKETVLAIAFVLASILAALTGLLSGRHYASLTRATDARTAALAAQLARQETQVCFANRAVLKLLNGSYHRTGQQAAAIKNVDTAVARKQRAAYLQALQQLAELIDSYGPAVAYCEKTRPNG